MDNQINDWMSDLPIITHSSLTAYRLFKSHHQICDSCIFIFDNYLLLSTKALNVVFSGQREVVGWGQESGGIRRDIVRRLLAIDAD